MITLSTCHHNLIGPRVTDRVISPWISHELGQKTLSGKYLCVYVCVHLSVDMGPSMCVDVKVQLSACGTLWTRICGHVGKSVSSYDLSVYIRVSKFMHVYIISICLLLCRRKGGAEDGHHLFVHSKNIHLGDDQARL